MGAGASLDPKPGGSFRLDVDGEHFAAGEYVEVDPPRRIVMTWGWERRADVAPGSTLVEITLTPDGDGTLLRLRHTDLPSEASRLDHTDGWNRYLGNLAELLDHR